MGIFGLGLHANEGAVGSWELSQLGRWEGSGVAGPCSSPGPGLSEQVSPGPHNRGRGHSDSPKSVALSPTGDPGCGVALHVSTPVEVGSWGSLGRYRLPG